MWTLVLFDLPITTHALRKAYERFRGRLLDLGFEMLQKSVYRRWEDSDAAAETLRRHVLAAVPQCGQVTLLQVTHRTWRTASIIHDGEARPAAEKPANFLVFG